MSQDRRMTLTVAFAVVCASTALFPPFNGAVWFDAGIGATITVAAAGTLSRIRTLPPIVCLLISLTGLALYLNLAFEARLSFWWVVPTRASVHGLGGLVTGGFREASSYSPPVPTTVTGLVFLAVAGIGITAVMTDLIAVRLRSTAMAGLPLLVLFTVPATINVQRSGISTVVIFTLGTGGYLAMLGADGRERIRVWGRLVSLWRPDGSSRYAGPGIDPAASQEPEAGGRHRAISLRGPDTRGLAAAGRRVGIASIVLALLAPLLVPGLHAARLASQDWVFGNGTSSSGGTPVPDLLSIVSQQLQARQHVVMTYVTNDPDPGYLQQEVRYTLTDTNGWEEPFPGDDITTDPFSTLPPEQGVTSPGPLVTTTITTAKGAFSPDSGFNELPAAFPPVSVSGLPGSWQDDPSTLMIVTQNASLDQVTYTVQSHNDTADSAQLGKAPAPQQDMSQYLELPPSYSQSSALLKLTRSLIKGDTTELAKANAIAKWLHVSGGFVYDIFAPQITNVTDLLSFLEKVKTGDCVQAAYAMTVMLRLLDIPARLVLGYTQGTETSPGHYTVMSSDAHAWPEAYFSGYGWIRFEPVPPGGTGTSETPGYSQQTGTSTGGNAPPVLPGQSKNTGGNDRNGPGGRHLTNPGSGGPADVLPFVAAPKPTAGTPWTALALAVLAALALACGIIAIVAPLGQAALSTRPGERRRWRLNGSVLLLILAGGAIVAIVLERLLTHTRGVNLTAGWETIGIAFGAACAVALAVPISCRAVIRRWRWRRAADDAAARAHIAWLELRADLADYGLAPLPSESPRALAGRVTTGLALAEPAAEAVGRIALAEERATYSARPAEAETLHEDSLAARHGIAAAAGRGARWRARLFPASMMAAFADAAGRVPGAWAAWTARFPGRRL